MIAVCGASAASAEDLDDAEAVGRALAQAGAVVLCGGLGGVMAAVARGARSAGGVSIGLLPGDTTEGAAENLTVAVPTGLGELRNALLVRACASMIAIGGGYGTLSEIGFALRLGRPVVALHSWEVRRHGESAPDSGVEPAPSPGAAARRALELAAAPAS